MGFHSALFNYITRTRLIYSSCWEDPDIDRQALRLDGNDRVLVITSAGCNALDYLLAGAGRVDAVDCNPCQGYLLEFKVAAIRTLDYGSFFKIFGLGGCAEVKEMYWDAARKCLPEEARRYWDRHLHLVSGGGWRKSFYHKSTSGMIHRGVTEYLYRVKGLRAAIERLLSAPDLNEQREIYASYRFRSRLDTPAFRWLLSRQFVMSLLAIPSAQRGEVESEYVGGWASFSLDAIDKVINRTLIRHNPFWYVALAGRYATDSCPLYLQPDGFNHLKQGLLDRLYVHTATVTDYLASSDGLFSKYVLLDHLDWMSQENPEALQDEWSEILRTAKPGARIIFRSATANAKYLDGLEVWLASKRRRLSDLISFDLELAGKLHSQDRVCIYGSFHIADLAATMDK